MYHEDVDWSLRAEKKGYKNYYIPTTTVFHKIESHRDKKGRVFRNFFIKRNSQILVWKHAKFRDLIFFYIHFSFVILKTIIKALKDKNITFIYLQNYSIIQGFIIGVKKRTNRSFKKYLLKNYYLIKRCEKKFL